MKLIAQLFGKNGSSIRRGVAKTLDNILRLMGVIASEEFASDGKLLAFRSKRTLLSNDEALLRDQYTVAVSQLLCALTLIPGRISGLLGVLAAGHGQSSGFNLVPEQGWVYSGGDLTIVVGGGLGVFAKTAEADFNQLFTVLIEPRQLAGVGER